MEDRRSLADAPAITIGQMVIDHEKRLGDIERVLAELSGAMKLMRLVLGTSVVGAIAAIVQLVIHSGGLR